MMTEEQVTKAILNRLIEGGWNIVAFDFPQSGSGRMLHPDGEVFEKNRGGIIPDIVAVKNSTCLFFENKDRVVVDDFLKIALLINDNHYTRAISRLLEKYPTEKILYGIGFPAHKWNDRAAANATTVDFIVGVTVGGNVEFLYNPWGIVL